MMRRSSLLSYAGCEAQPHFLESCSLCQKSIGRNNDIFMYRGDTPFCSQECRQEQIERDEAKERRWKVSSSSSKRSSSNKQTSDATKKSSSVQTAGTVAVA